MNPSLNGEKISPPVTLTEKQRLFVDHYIITQNATQSALKAGYSATSARYMGYETLQKPYIQEAIRERFKQVEATRGWTPVEIRLKIQEIAKAGKTDADKLRALELLGRATPGTFERPTAAPDINLFAILGDIVKRNPGAPASAVDVPAIIEKRSALPAPDPEAPPGHSADIPSTGTEHEDLAVFPTPDGTPTSPPPPSNVNDIVPQKISDHFQDNNSRETLENKNADEGGEKTL